MSKKVGDSLYGVQTGRGWIIPKPFSKSKRKLVNTPIENFSDRELKCELKKRGYTVFKSKFDLSGK